MKKYIFIVSVALVGCSTPIKETYTTGINDTTSVKETHFDCIALECKKYSEGSYQVTTECGIVFQSNISYEPNTVLKKFNSPKHK